LDVRRHRVLLEVALEPGERCGPRLGVLAHPTVVDEPDRDRVEEVQLLAAALARGHEPRLLQHPQVLHHAEAGHRHPLLQRAEGLPVPREERVEQPPPRGIGERLEDPVHGGEYM
jgi:hypothetical protein